MKYEEIATDSKNGSTIPKGKYLCQIKEATETQSKSGADMLKLKLKIVEGEFKGRIIFDQLSFNCKRPKNFAIALVMAKKTDKDFELDSDKVLGKLVYVMIEEEKYEGQVRSKVTFDGYGKVPTETIIKTLEELKQEKDEDDEEELTDNTDEEIEAVEDIYAKYNL